MVGTHPSGNADELQRAAEFRTALRRFLARTEQAAASSRLTPQRYDLLLMIETGEGGCSTVTELTRRLHLGQPAVTELVKRAEVAGLVERMQSEQDRRVSFIRLTAEGRRRLMRAFVALRDDRQEVAQTLRAVGSSFRVLDSRGQQGS